MDIETFTAIDPVADEWEELAERTDAPPWLRAGWTAAWWRAFGNGDLHIIVIRRNGSLSAIAPLVSLGGTLSSPTNWHTPDFRLTAEDDEARTALLEAIYGSGRRRITFGFVDQRDADSCREVAERKGFRVLDRTLEEPPFVPTDGDREAYERSMDRHVMSETRRRRRRLSEQGELVFEVKDGSEGLDRLLEEGFRVEASGWKAQAGTAIISQEETRRFYAELAHWNAENGWLRLAFLRLDGRAVAFQYLVEHGGIVSQLKGGFDEEYRKFAPGTLLLQDVIAWAFDGDATRFEFLGAEEAFKLEWAPGKHDRRLVQAFAPSLPGLVDRTAWTYGRPLAKRIRDLVRR